jgi:hypothetical protein
MWEASPSTEARRARLARMLGIATLLVVQGGCGATLLGLLRLERRTTVERPTRAAARQALEHLGPAALMFPSAGGTIDYFGDDEIVVMSVSGQRVRVRIDRDTLVVGRDGPAELSDLYPGCEVVVSGVVQPDGDVLADLVQVQRP